MLEQVVDLGGEARIAVGDGVFGHIDNLKLIDLLGTRVLEEHVKGAVGTLEVLGGIEGVGDALGQHLEVFLFLGLAAIDEVGSGGLLFTEDGEPGFQFGRQGLALGSLAAVFQEGILDGLLRGVHVLRSGDNALDGGEPAKLLQQFGYFFLGLLLSLLFYLYFGSFL